MHLFHLTKSNVLTFALLLPSLLHPVYAQSAEGVDSKTVRMNYFRTSEAETMALDAWIKQQKASPGRYQLCTQNCGVFTVRGLVAAGAVSPKQAGGLSIDPNLLFWQLGNLADQNQPAINKEKVTSKVCFTDESGNQTCQ